jgi:hypothetical protein
VSWKVANIATGLIPGTRKEKKRKKKPTLTYINRVSKYMLNSEKNQKNDVQIK